MIFLIGFIFIALFSIITLVIIFTGASTQSKQATVLNELGLVKKWWGGKTTAFYKWSWRKISKERIWGERNVKEAFQKAKVWLTQDDLHYFEQKCKEFQKYRKVNDEQIKTKVEEIIRRTDEVEESIRSIVKEMLRRISSISESQAKQVLQESGINIEGKDRILQRYGTLEIRRMADRIGQAVLGFAPTKSEIPGISHIQGVEGWEHWLNVYKQTLLSEATRNTTSTNHLIYEGILSSIRSGLLKDYEQDIQSYKSFIESMDSQIDGKHFAVKPDAVKELERILYTWQFSSSCRFNNADHNRMRQLISRTDLSPRFRLFLFQGIHRDYDSIQGILSKLPRNIVFFGKNGFGRAYAADQYHLHVEKCLDVLARISGANSKPPGIITITETELENKRKEMAAEGRGAALQGKALDVIDTTMMAIQALFDKKKLRSMEKRKVEMEEADHLGWLVDFPWDEQNVEVFGLFRHEPFQMFNPIHCDIQGNVDFLSNNNTAKRQRLLYFNIILDSILQTSPFETLAESNA